MGSKRKRKSPPISPPVSVQERKSKFEAVQAKYRERCQKISREKQKIKREKKPKPEEDSSIESLLKSINANIESMKADLKENNKKIGSVNDKIQDLEVNAEKTAKSNKLQFEMMNGKIARIETNVTDKVIEKIDPQLKTLRGDLRKDLNEDLKTLVEEEFARRFPEEKKDATNTDESSQEEGRGEP